MGPPFSVGMRSSISTNLGSKHRIGFLVKDAVAVTSEVSKYTSTLERPEGIHPTPPCKALEASRRPAEIAAICART